MLEENPDLTQRELGVRVGISLGAVNYCLKVLIDRGLIKAGNFRRSPNKLGYAYLLTAAGIAEKASLTGRFLKCKIAEYEALRLEIDALTREASTARSGVGALAESELNYVTGDRQFACLDPSINIENISGR